MTNEIMELEKYYEVLYFVTNILNNNKIEYMVTGSMAGKFYGLKRNPNDIDIDVFDKSIPLIENLFKDNITERLYHCKDDFGDEYILEVTINDIVIEFCVVDRGYIHSNVTGEKISTLNFYIPIVHKFKDIDVMIQSLDALIGYKQHNTNKEFAQNQIDDVKELVKYQN